MSTTTSTTEAGGKVTPEDVTAALAADAAFDRAAFDEKIATAKFATIVHPRIKMPYLAAGILRMKVVPNPFVPKMGIDPQWRVYANPEFVMSSSTTLLATALLHEVQHNVLEHHARKLAVGVPDEMRMVWNSAGDAAINQALWDRGAEGEDTWLRYDTPGIDLPHGCATEQGYRILAERLRDQEKSDDGQPGEDESQPGEDESQSGEGQPGDGEGKTGKGKGQGKGELGAGNCGSGAGGEEIPGQLPADGEGAIKGMSETLLRRKIAQEVKAHEKGERGSVPGHLTEWADELLTPKVNWWQELGYLVRNAVAMRAGSTESSFRRRPRMNPTDFVMPGKVSPEVVLAVVWDTSGSVSDAQLQQGATEVEGILRSLDLSDDNIVLVTVDAEVAETRRVSTLRNLSIGMGRGGTDLRVGVRHALKEIPGVNIILMVTDGETPHIEEPPPGVEVVMAVLGGSLSSYWQPPEWMKVVFIPDEG